jgi:hypothetical protein
VSADVRRRLLRVGAALAIGAASLVALMESSGAAAAVQSGWWNRDVPLTGTAPAGGQTVTGRSASRPQRAWVQARPSQEPPVLPPTTLPPAPLPTVPPSVTIPGSPPDAPVPTPTTEGQLVVAGDPFGARAIAALRFDGADAGGATLTLHIATGSTPGPLVRACPTLTAWLPGANQPWPERPADDCARLSITPTVAPDGSTITWDLPQDFKPSGAPTYDVLLLPSTGDGTPFQTTFDKPGEDAFTVTSPPLDELTSTSIESPLPLDVPPGADVFSSDGFAVDSVPYGATGVTTPVAPPPEPVLRTPARAPIAALLSPLESPTTRRVAVVVLLALGAYLYWQSTQSVERAPRLLGALAGPSRVMASAISRPMTDRPRGIGRFQRAREGPSTKL